jgi:hypothetical protein
VAPAELALAVSVTGTPCARVVATVGEVKATVGTAAVTVIFTGEDVAVVPVESVTRAVRDAAPATVGVQAIEYGGAVATPIWVAPAKKATWVMEAPELAVGTATTVVSVFATTDVPPSGAESEIVGANPFTVRTTALDVVVSAPDCVATAVSVFVPTVDGVQTTEYGSAVSIATETPFTKNSTWVIDAPELGVAFAVIVVGAPKVGVAEPVGAVIATVGAGEINDTGTPADVTVAPVESVTFAVRVRFPPAAGVQVVV